MNGEAEVKYLDAAMVKQLEVELPTRRDGVGVRLADGRTLLVHGDSLLVDGVAVDLSPAPASVLQALLVNPGHVVSRRALLASLPGITASGRPSTTGAAPR